MKNSYYLQNVVVLSLGLCITFINTACSEPSAKITTLEPSDEESTAVTRPAPTEETVKFGVLSIDSAVSVNERYAPLMDYLTETTGHSFELVPVTQVSQFEAVEAKALDFTTNNPLAAVQLQRLYDTQFLATYSRPKTGLEFSALIIVRDDSDIQSLNDLKDKHVACVNFQTAAAGCIFQIQHLLENGIDPFNDFGQFEENKSQDNIVFAVLNGSLDAGFIRTGQLEIMISRGMLDSAEEIRVLDPRDDGFLYEHTTALYPEWPIAALEETNPELVEAVKTALMAIPPEHPALQAAKIEEFVPTADYNSIEVLIENLQLKSWDAPSSS